jgi:hypothetical protein
LLASFPALFSCSSHAPGSYTFMRTVIYFNTN